MKMNLYNTMKVDLKRAFFTWKFSASVILGALVCFFTLLFCGSINSDTVHTFLYIHDKSQSFLAYIVGIIPYVMCFYDDFSYGNIKNVLGRINIHTYTFSKTVAAIISTSSAFGLGKLLFVLIHSLSHPLGTQDTINMIFTNMLFVDFVENEQYLIYLILTIFPRTLYCAILCQIAMLVSILIHNKAIVFTVPIAIYYVLNFYVNDIIGIKNFNFVYIFSGTIRMFQSDWFTICYAIIVALITHYIIYQLTVEILKGKICRG